MSVENDRQRLFQTGHLKKESTRASLLSKKRLATLPSLSPLQNSRTQTPTKGRILRRSPASLDERSNHKCPDGSSGRDSTNAASQFGAACSE
ncbi:hypothetical protein PoB_003213200 [Plakobranchus ocellatus]|uniref:Uncharacterized protein n=1 Tax=Plakobranchus ocellatus TaxID=259542 RepID=A0AAV4AF42_9GAST|nr:hypothetical protein PoB_003213200 [Plakobranchus ocellatus]